MKSLFKFIGKTLLILTSLILALVILLWLSFHLFLKPSPNISTVKIQNEEFCLGHACREQPKTLEEYVQETSVQLGEFYQNRLEFWPRDVYKDQIIYFVSGDKQKAWKTDMPNGTYNEISPSEVPNIQLVTGYPDEFIPLYPKDIGYEAFIQVIHQRELLNEQAYDDLIYLGTYDKILSYIHEGFHAYGQDEESWDAPNQNIQNRARSEYFENTEQRAWRIQTLDLLWQSIANDEIDENKVREAVATYRAYKEKFPQESSVAHFIDRVEGVARYIEIASSLRSTYDEVNSIGDQVRAYGLMVSALDPEHDVGLVSEGYELGAASGMVLDAIDANPNSWKESILSDPENTPLSILASRYPDALPDQAITPSAQRFTNMKDPKKRPPNVSALLTMLYEMIF